MKAIPIFAIAIIASAITAAAQGSVLIDFQAAYNGHQDAGSTYNIANLGSGSDFTMSLNDTTGSSSGIGMELVADGGWALVQYPNGGTSPYFSDAAAGDGIRTSNEADGLTSLTLSGLNDAQKYNITLYAHSALSFSGNVDYTFGGVAKTGVDAAGGAATLVWTGLVPTGGQLVLTMQAHGAAGSHQLTRADALNAMSITAADTPAPATLALLGLGALAWLPRRRRHD